MKNALAIASLVVALIQTIADLVKTFETEGNGPAKKNIVLQMLEATFNFLREKLSVDVEWGQIRGVLDRAIDAVVAFYNAIGVFRKSKL